MNQEAIFEACARAAHEANRVYCIALGDTSQPTWEEAPDWQKKSARVGVEGVLLKGNGAEASHESWLAEKKREGWKFGEMKNPEKKEHPCFVPYEELPLAQRRKDDIFINSVTTMAYALGWVAK